MTKEEALFSEIGATLAGTTRSQLFGKPCYKINKKAFICFFENELVFKLPGAIHQSALDLEGAQLFDPSKKNRPMKEWVQVPANHIDKWPALANEAMDYVSEITTTKK